MFLVRAGKPQDRRCRISFAFVIFYFVEPDVTGLNSLRMASLTLLSVLSRVRHRDRRILIHGASVFPAARTQEYRGD